MKLHLIPAAMLGLVLASGPLAAGPFRPAQVPADAIWFAHLDLDQLKQTQFGQHILAELDKPENKPKLDVVQAIFNFDPRTALRGCTLYSRGLAPQDAVLLVTGQFDNARLETLAKAGKDYQSTEFRKHVIHSWIDEKKPDKPRTYAAIHSGTVIMGQKSESVGDALNVLDNTSPNLGGSEWARNAAAGAGSASLMAAVRRTPLMDGNPQAGMIRHFDAISLVSREAGGDMVADLAAQVDSADSARHVANLCRGFISLLALQGDNPGALKLAAGGSVSESGNRVVTTFKLNAADFVRMIQEDAARKKKAGQP